MLESYSSAKTTLYSHPQRCLFAAVIFTQTFEGGGQIGFIRCRDWLTALQALQFLLVEGQLVQTYFVERGSGLILHSGAVLGV